MKLNDKAESRFGGSLSDEYELNLKVYPHQAKIHDRVGKLVKKLLGSRIKSHVLEIGCGIGDTTKPVLSYAPHIHLTCVDNSASMIRQAGDMLHLFPRADVLLKKTDALRYLKESPTASIDIIFSAYTLHNFKKEYRAKVITELSRVLKPRGCFINADILYSSNGRLSKEQFSWLAAQLDNYDQLKRPDLKRKWLRHITADRDPNRILLEDTYAKQLRSAGFTKVENMFRYHSDAILVAKK